MPQDSLRSVVYRSFVTCDDPKGVVECRTSRKSKTDSKKMEGKVESQKMPKNLIRSLSYKEAKEETVSKGPTEELHNPSSFQLMEVSKGAQKLKQVIDSWSMGMSFDGQYKDIAKDLLRGALDLQKSLDMLGKLQDASKYMDSLNKKQREKVGGGRSDEVRVERTNSNRFENYNYEKGSQNPRLSADGSSRDCFEELREAIKDGLARQNLLLNSYSKEKAYFERRKLDLSPDIPSTSSSRSLISYSHDFASSDFPLSSKFPEEKPKGANLVAKLMGLEEIPSKALQSTPKKQLERDKVLSQRRPIFDIDIPKATKPQKVDRKLDPEWMTLEEIIEVMQFKGLLKSYKDRPYHSNTSHVEKKFSGDAPPIVIMKPLRPGLEAEELCTQTFIPEEGTLDTEEISTNSKTKEQDWEGALDSNEVCRKLQVEETPIKKLHQEKGAKECKKILAKPEVKEVRIKEKPSSNKVKASVAVSAMSQKKEAVEKKVDKIQKMTSSRRKSVEMENVKSTSVSKTHEGKGILTKLRKPESRSNITKNLTPQQKSTTSNSISTCTTPEISHNSNDRKKSLKNEKPVSEPLASSVESIRCNKDDVQNEVACKTESDMTVTDITPTVQLLIEEEIDTTEIHTKENCGNSQNSLCEATLLTIEHESGTKPPEENNDGIGQDIMESKCCETRANILLSNPIFLTHAEELFDIDAHQRIVLQPTSLNDWGTPNSRLLLDCAKELVERERLRQIPTVHPLLQNPLRKSRFCISVDQLVAEVGDGIENLRSYSKIAGASLPSDTVYAVLKRDLGCKGVVCGSWDMGWRDGLTVDKVEQVMVDIDELVLSELIEEVLTDIML